MKMSGFLLCRLNSLFLISVSFLDFFSSFSTSFWNRWEKSLELFYMNLAFSKDLEFQKDMLKWDMTSELGNLAN